MRQAAALILLVVAVLGAGAAAQKARPEMLVSTEWLGQHLNDSEVVIIHVGGDPADFQAAHIPGARHLATKDLTKSDPPGAELPPPEQLKKTFEALGASDKTRIVLYSPDWQPFAARAWFTLDYLGHGDHAAMLNGGMDQWLKEGRPLSSETKEVKAGELTLRLKPEVVAAFEDVQKLTTAGVPLDARPTSRYRAGHIPGAVPLFWEKMVRGYDDPLLKSEADLRQLFQKAGMEPGKKVVPYCEVGYQSSFAYFVAKYLGYDTVNYDGSWNDWNGIKKAEAVRGDKRR